MATSPDWLSQVQSFGDLSKLPPDVWAALQKSASGPISGSQEFDGYTIAPQVSYGQGMDNVGNNTLQGFSVTPDGQWDGAGSKYGNFDASGKYTGVGTVLDSSATSDFLTFLAGAGLIALGGPMMTEAMAGGGAGAASVASNIVAGTTGATGDAVGGGLIGDATAGGYGGLDAASASSLGGGYGVEGGAALSGSAVGGAANTNPIFNQAQDSQIANANITAAGGDPYTAAGSGAAGTGVSGSPYTMDSASALSSPAAQQIKSLIPGITNSQLLSMLGTGLGSLFSANAAKKAASTSASAATNAANILSPAATQAAKLQADAATKAGGILSDAALTGAGQKVAGLNAGLDVAGNVLGLQEALQAPLLSAGSSALAELTADLKPGGKFNRSFTMADAQNMPAYQFALEQGLDAARNAESAGGMQLSSNAIHDQTKFAEGTAAQYENQAFNQWLSQNNLSLGALQQMVKTGQVSVEDLSAALQNYGVSAETLHSAIGNANAAGTTGSGNALAAGAVGSAGYTAQGIRDAAQAQASGVIGAGNANANGTTSQGNILGSGLSNLGNMFAQTFTPTQTQTQPTSVSVPNPAAPNTTSDTYTAPPSNWAGPDKPLTMDQFDWMATA